MTVKIKKEERKREGVIMGGREGFKVGNTILLLNPYIWNSQDLLTIYNYKRSH